MRAVQIIWDLADDPQGNYWHICVEGHGITQEEVVEVLMADASETAISRNSGNFITFGWTSSGKHIAVLWSEANQDPLMIYPLTAYPVPPKRAKGRKERKQR